MKRLIVLALFVPLALFSCFDDDPADPKDEDVEGSPYTGTFTVSSTFTGSDCNFSAPEPPSTLSIVVSGDVIAIGTVVGTWHEGELRGVATSSQTCIPIPAIHEDCERCYDFTYDIVYSHPDSFSGVYTVIFYHSVECEVDDCSTTYDIVGAR